MPAADPHLPELDPDLVALASAYGVAVEYTDQAGVVRQVSAASIRAVLAAMDVEAGTAAQCRTAMKEVRAARWRSALPPSIVMRRNAADTDPWETWVHVQQGQSVRVWIELEEGGRRFDVSRTDRQLEPGRVDGSVVDEVIFRIPKDLPLGWHRLVAEAGGEVESCALVITPERLDLPVLNSPHQGWGVATQLYSARSHQSWGIGDLVDLSDLTSWFGREHGADFILVNPLHAAAPTPGMEPSPYLPITRRYVNPIYVRVEAIPEFAYLPDDVMTGVLRDARAARGHLNGLPHLDRDGSWAHKLPALLAVFQVSRTPGREALLSQFRREEGDGLRQFAIWCAISAVHGPGWDQWPPELQDRNNPAVSRFAAEHADEVEFYTWLQWVLDEQMAVAQHDARVAGMTIGVMHDLAVGVHPFGSDTWSEPEVTATGVSVGAPPDTFNQVGQNWSQPPRRPDELAATGYASYRDMLRTLLRNSGGLRIDHVLGLFRLWWIPEGLPPSEGTYVRYDHHAMVNILVLEAQRAEAVLVGEDLGTVEPWVRDFLADRGVLGTTILWFEREKGVPLDPQKWRANAMAAVTVHDLPPTLGYLAGDHVTLRDGLGLLARPVETELAEHADEIAAWRAALERNSLLRPGASDADVVTALHRYVSWSPSKLISVSLADLVGERRTQNQPGTKDEYPNWRIPLGRTDGTPVFIEDYPNIPRLAQIVAAMGGSTSRT